MNTKHAVVLKNVQFQSNATIYLLSVMHIATCFDPEESSSGYSMNHNIATSSDSAHFGIPKSLLGKIQVELSHNYCPGVLNSN